MFEMKLTTFSRKENDATCITRTDPAQTRGCDKHPWFLCIISVNLTPWTHGNMCTDLKDGTCVYMNEILELIDKHTSHTLKRKLRKKPLRVSELWRVS